MRNPGLVGGNAFKLGLFGFNCSGGRSIVKLAERWDASWENNLALARLADAAGIEALIPIARWKGYGGETNFQGASFETITWATGLLAATQRTNVFGTVHVPLLHPVFAAKQIVTADHVGRGRFGVNIVCGWNGDEFGMFAADRLQHDDRYALGEEWWQVVQTIWSEAAPVDHDGRYFKLRGLEGAPGPFGGERPIMMNAGASAAGREFAVRNSDLHFDFFEQPSDAMARIKESKRMAAALGRDLQVWTPVGVVCRPTAREADEYLQRCVENADWGAIDHLVELYTDRMASMSRTASELERQRLHDQGRLVVARAAYSLFGDPDQVAAKLRELSEIGFDGVAINFVNYLDELPYFVQEVLPRLEAMGLRRAAG